MTDQKRTALDWQEVSVFLALARHGSLSAAARMLSVSHATIAPRIHSLEDSLGEKLVERRPDGYVLTIAGTHALQAASEMEDAAQALTNGKHDGTPSGLIRLSSSPGLSNIAIRVDVPKDGDIIARPLTTIAYGFYGTEEASRTAEAGSDLVFIGFNEADAYLTQAAWMTKHFSRARVAFRAKDQFLQSLAARSGIGLALIPHYIGRSDPALQICDLGVLPPSRDVYLLTRSRDRKNASIRVVADSVADMFEQDRDLFV
jgi:molybdate transport repressor ModE-like protein